MVSQSFVTPGAPPTKSRKAFWREVPAHFALKALETLKESTDNVYLKVGGGFKDTEVDL